MNVTGVLTGRGDEDTDNSSRRMTRTRRGHSEKVAIFQPRRETSVEANPADPLIDLVPLASRIVRNKFLFLRIPSLWYFVLTA